MGGFNCNFYQHQCFKKLKFKANVRVPLKRSGLSYYKSSDLVRGVFGEIL